MAIKGRVSLPRVLSICLLLLVAVMVLYPLGMVFYGSVWSSSPGAPGHFTLKGYVEAYGQAHTYALLGNTFILAVIRTVFSVAIAVLLAWLVTRTNVPHRNFLELGLLFVFFMPLLPRVVAWILLLSPRTGLINVFLRNILPFDIPALNVFSYGGIIWVGVLSWVPILYIFVAPAFRAMDGRLEDAARMSGAGLFATVTRINLPLLAPAILATTVLGFVRMMESFTIEAMLGIRAKIYVLTTQIYGYIVYPDLPDYPPAMALAVTLLVLTFALVVFQWRLLGQKHYPTVTGRGFQARPVDLRRSRWPAFAAAFLFIALSMFLPLGVLLWASVMKVPGVFMDDMYTLAHYRATLNDPTLWTAVKNSVLMAMAVASIGMVLCGLMSYIVVKTRFFGRRALDLISWIPWAVPGIVLALGFLWAALLSPLPFTLYGTLTLMSLCLIIKGMPLGTRTMSSTLVQISDELEEAARIHGASWSQTFVRVVLPLLAHGFAAGWILLFAFALKELDAVIMLAGPQSSVISTQIFSWWQLGHFQAAAILGLLESVLITIFFLAAQLLSRHLAIRAEV
ncbi:MAG: iron ABC transporter permease [Deltaproteobacteria bacterium]|nr:iron ABC transporter permease [Deltaproteobacteria bacterium]